MNPLKMLYLQKFKGFFASKWTPIFKIGRVYPRYLVIDFVKLKRMQID